ncbi:Rieske 2Fe-2S domain-containing protein [Lipingzhangella sp. LS1_29]|uniref:Cytochrome bc1 complex Rieske iron-sulfur subunit n=1 Tax=Lipingzhangella rawalii TaxID=2055835 RepID=A0ABU2H1G5_9ACTN|nr:Rieske 2Fe-2S domain-containing protein [Lipingzhangella rawalii]MDS1268689.1 Rieske 2Fe-2S domain-containing protein [Lipingzhangella rawalii]
MTENPQAPNSGPDPAANEASGTGGERVIGTPTGGTAGPTGMTADAPQESTPSSAHEGPYPPEETHLRTEEEQRRGERIAALWFVIAFLAGVGFIVSYFLFPPGPDGPAVGDPSTGQIANIAMGGTLTVALFAIGAGMTVWVRRVIPHYEVASPYDELPSDEQEKSSFGEFFMRGANESGFTRRPLMRRTLFAAMLPLGVAPIVLLRDTGPLPGDILKQTMWEDGMHMVVEGTSRRIRAEDLATPGGMITALPENPEDPEHPVSLNDQSKTVIILIKMRPDDFDSEMTEEQLGWTHNGIIAYSKICTHVGCPAALYEPTTHRILCPCHQSTFDAANAAKVVFGPAHRPLPILPIRVDDEGYLVAAGDFSSPVGPTFWDAERDNYLAERED